jgi:hypothetical protein
METVGSNGIEKKVIYTVVFGEKYALYEPLKKYDGWRYICFTDKDIKSDIWEIVKFPPVKTPAITSRYFKLLFHLHFDSEINIYIDGNLQVVGNPDDMIQHLKNTDVAFHIHPNRKCIYEEAEACKRLSKDSPLIIDSHINKYRRENYPVNNGLIAGGVIVRRNTANSQNMMKQWFCEFLNGSKRDQLSWNYVAWKNRYTYTVIDRNIRNNTFCVWKTNLT